jgi:hypothetical protein
MTAPIYIQIATLVFSFIAVLSSLFGAVFVYGKLTERVNNNTAELNKHDERITVQGQEIAELQGWRSNASCGVMTAKVGGRL